MRSSYLPTSRMRTIFGCFNCAAARTWRKNCFAVSEPPSVFMRNLQSDSAIELRIAGGPDGPHGTNADLTEQLEMMDIIQATQLHGSIGIVD